MHFASFSSQNFGWDCFCNGSNGGILRLVCHYVLIDGWLCVGWFYFCSLKKMVLFSCFFCKLIYLLTVAEPSWCLLGCASIPYTMRKQSFIVLMMEIRRKGNFLELFSCCLIFKMVVRCCFKRNLLYGLSLNFFPIFVLGHFNCPKNVKNDQVINTSNTCFFYSLDGLVLLVLWIPCTIWSLYRKLYQ